MAHISKLFFWRHLRAEPNQYILHYKDGTLVRRGAGLSYWFYPLSAAVAQLPVEDCETTFLLRERSLDFQEVAVQCTVTYRVSRPEQAAARVDFTISLETGAWVAEPLARLASIWSQRAQQPARSCVATVPIVEALRAGPDVIRRAVHGALASDPELAAMGLTLVNTQVDRIAPTSELEKALQTPTREAIQQKADEAVFGRRALAVEKERAIKENELATEVELAKGRESLILQQSANRQLEVEKEAEAEKARVEAQMERNAITAEAGARDTRVRAAGEAEAARMIAESRADGEARRVAVWTHAPNKVVLGLALQEFAGNVHEIQHLSLTPDLIGTALQQFLTDQAGKS